MLSPFSFVLKLYQYKSKNHTCTDAWYKSGTYNSTTRSSHQLVCTDKMQVKMQVNTFS